MYRFLAKPRWIAFTILVVLLVILMINLGFWQLRRLHERRAINHQVISNDAAALVSLRDLVDPAAPLDSMGGVQWRRVIVTGTYDEAHQVLVRNRSYNSSPGEHVVVPLRLADGTAVLVNRGWIPESTSAGKLPTVPPAPTGTVQLIARIRVTQQRGLLGPRDPATGVLSEVNRVDIARIRQQTPYPLYPVYLELPATTVEVNQLPQPLPLPELDDGPHLSYAVQWFIFTVCAMVGWVLVVRKSVRTRRQQAAAATAEAADTPTPVSPSP
jgi:cytochrome oxidase assembly protein ShyY1